MGGSSKPATQKFSGTSTETSQATPYAFAEPLIQDMLTRAQGAQAATPTTPTFTGPNSTQLASVDMLRGLLGKTDAGYGAVLDNANKTAQGFYTSGEGRYSSDINPFVQGVIQAAINPLRDQLDANVLSIGDAAKMAGAYGGDRGDLLKATALSRFNRDAMDVGSQVSYQATEAERQRAFQAQQAERAYQMQAAGLFSDANELLMNPARIGSALGDQIASWDLAAKQSAIDAPWSGLDRYSQILSGISPYASTSGTSVENSTTTGTPARGSKTQGALSGALGGASAGAAFGPWGAGIGAVLGGLGGLFG